MRIALPGLLLIAVLALLAGCEPEDRRPGMRLGGDPAPGYPDDWAFTNNHQEIALQLTTPYLLPHAVTIWCAEMDGDLYLGASNPDSKRWPAWVDRRPEVKLQIDGLIYPVRLEPLTDPQLIDALQRVYAVKYQLGGVGGGDSRYWRVRPRAAD